MLRLLLVIPIYLIVLIYLERLPALMPLFDRLSLMPVRQMVMTALAVTAISGVGIIFFLKHPIGTRLIKSHSLFKVLLVGFAGALFAALNVLFDAAGGRPPQIYYILVFPLAFMVAEAVYVAVIAVRMWHMKKSGSWDQFDQADGGESAEPSDRVSASPVVRIFVYIFFYALIVGLLPYQTDYARLVASLKSLHPLYTLGVSIAALILGAGTAFYAVRYKDPHRRRDNGQPGWGWIALSAAGSGLAFGGAINALSYAFQIRGDLSVLIVVTIAFVIAELVVTLIAYRMNREFEV